MEQIKKRRFHCAFGQYFPLFILIVFLSISCNQPDKEIQRMQSRIDSLQNESKNAYRPGLGEFMLGIQLHHAKLWFAGQNQNWPLADFEVHEILESLDDIRQFCQDRPEVKAIGMIDPAIDSVNNAIQQKDPSSFKRGFFLLTNTCNDCHKATNHSFNVVTIPSNLPVVNQDFKPSQPISK